MYPHLFTIGDLTVHSYGVMAVAAILAAGLVVQSLARRLHVDRGVALELTAAAVVGGLAGARLYWLAEHWQEVRGMLLHALVGGSGFTWYGGLLGGTVAVMLVARFRHVPLGTTANIMAPAVALGYAVARVGCFLAGDGTYGRPSDLPWAMSFPQGSVPTLERVQPTAIYEALVMLAVFFVLYRLARTPRRGWYVFAWFLVASGTERLLVELLRVNDTVLLGLTAPQLFAVASIVVGASVLVSTGLLSRERLESPA